MTGASVALGSSLSFAQKASELTAAQRGEDFSQELLGPDWKPAFLNSRQNETLIAISDLIIPATDTPGAKEALVNRFLDLLLAAEPKAEQDEFIASLTFLDDESNRQYKSDFVSLSVQDQTDLLRPLAYPLQASFWKGGDAPDVGRQHFEHLKSLIAGAYYSSEIGEKELGWDGSFTHGPFQGCQHADAKHT